LGGVTNLFAQFLEGFADHFHALAELGFLVVMLVFAGAVRWRVTRGRRGRSFVGARERGAAGEQDSKKGRGEKTHRDLSRI
jgi:hypothetical protein